ncbi:hypothetical protein SSX86_026599 [Deinandra increscens subsp. villosa]|uniref:Ataxin-2 C-terminal domain-containing protein n=1 Tax=Deinandra increscens subsp. villosa TaxID=3103831 RepID=A0AAP0GN77_9ASTR
MSVVSQGRSTLNPNAPLFVPAAVRQVEDFSPEWWQLVTTSTWYHDYWLSHQQAEDGFFGNSADERDIVDMLPDSIDTDEDLLSMEAQYEQFLNSPSMETVSAFSSPRYKQMTSNGKLQYIDFKGDYSNVVAGFDLWVVIVVFVGLETEAEALIRSLSLSKSTRGSQVEMARYQEKAVKSFSPRMGSQRIQQPR